MVDDSALRWSTADWRALRYILGRSNTFGWADDFPSITQQVAQSYPVTLVLHSALL